MSFFSIFFNFSVMMKNKKYILERKNEKNPFKNLFILIHDESEIKN